MSDYRLGSAQWEFPQTVSNNYPFVEGKFWLGRALDGTALGYQDDRHICVVSGTRGGKGTGYIINNLCFWPGSAVVVDPKGENATVTTARRGRGSEYCEGMGQAVHVLDPFNAAQVEDSYRSCFNPLDALDPENEETIDEATRLADAIIIIRDESPEPFFDESARTLVRGLILHVLTSPLINEEDRNLIMLRKLLLQGEWRVAEKIRDAGHDPGNRYELLFQTMERNKAFGGIVAGIGYDFRSMLKDGAKTWESVRRSALNQTEFLDSPGMGRVLSRSDFKLSDLKTRPEGMTLYLSLPQRFMGTHFRWLRMMVALTTSEMEIVRGRPATGHRILMVLDEFAGLKRMSSIENAVAQIAGYGVKLFFVLQSLEQLKHTYKDNWETFLANAGTKVFSSIDDNFTREYISKQVGETEIRREVQSFNQSESQNESYAEGRSLGQSVSQSQTTGLSESDTEGTSRSFSRSRGTSETVGFNQSSGWSQGASRGAGWLSPVSPTTNSSVSGSSGNSRSTSDSESYSQTFGTSSSSSTSKSVSDTSGTSETNSTSHTRSQGASKTAGTGRSETLHHRPLISPDEVGRKYARIDDRSHPFYPGLALVLVTGANPIEVRRTHYFEDPQFIDCFGPHPDHEFLPALCRPIEGLPRFIHALEQCISSDTGPDGSRVLRGNRQLAISQWFVKPGTVANPGQPVLRIDGVPPDSRSVQVYAPYLGKVSKIADGQTLSNDELLTLKTYAANDTGIDPFIELRQACAAAMERLKPKRMEPPRPTISLPTFASSEPRRWSAGIWMAFCGLLFVIACLVIYFEVSHSNPTPAPPTVQRKSDEEIQQFAEWEKKQQAEQKKKHKRHSSPPVDPHIFPPPAQP